MKLLSVILVLLITVIAVAFWKDIKNMSARRSRREKEKLDPAKETVNLNKKDGQ